MSFLSHIVVFAQQVQAPDSINNVKVDLSGTTLQNVFNFILALAGAIAVAFIVFGGIKYILSQGDPNDIKQAKDTILYALVGVVVVVISFMLVNFVIGKF